MEVIEIHHLPAPPAPALVPVQTVKVKGPSKAAKRAREIHSDLHEFRRRVPEKTHISCDWLSSTLSSCLSACFTYMSLVPTWLWLTGLGLIIFAAISFFISTMIVYFYGVQPPLRPLFTAPVAPGLYCSSTSECVLNAYCVKTGGSMVGICTCAIDYYYDATLSTTACLTGLTNGGTCSSTSQCQTGLGLTCISNTCQCDSTTYFWNSTSSRCQYLKVVNDYCTSSSQCSTANSGCSGSNQCECNTNYYFDQNTGTCIARYVENVACTSNTQCINDAYCGENAGDTYSKCYCDPLSYYFDVTTQACEVRTSIYNTACALSFDACDLYTENLRCFNGKCGCDPTYELWNANYTKCLSLYWYSETCSTSVPYYNCITGSPLDLQCAYPDHGGIREICRCKKDTQYFDVIAGGCLNNKAYNSTCDMRSECGPYGYTQCATYGNSSVTKRCVCTPNYGAYSGGGCIRKLGYGVYGCTQDSDCYDYVGMICASINIFTSFGTCACSTLQFYNSTSGACQWLARAGDFCQTNSSCANGDCLWTTSLFNEPYCNPNIPP